MTASDLGIAAPILAAALWLLVRSARRATGGCHGCSGGCHAPRVRGDDLVRDIGRGRGAGAAGERAPGAPPGRSRAG